MSGAEPLCAQERETISRELNRGRSARCIGKQLGRHHSTITNEINRNGGVANYRLFPLKSVTSHLRLDRRSGNWWPRPGCMMR